MQTDRPRPCAFGHVDASALPHEDMVDWIRDYIAAASTAEDTGDERLREDTVDELRPLFVEYLRGKR